MLKKYHIGRPGLLLKIPGLTIGTTAYKPTLPIVPLSEDQTIKEYPKARAFADRLFTLPSHDGVDDAFYGLLESVLQTHDQRVQ